jgi:predicted Zn-dependent protease
MAASRAKSQTSAALGRAAACARRRDLEGAMGHLKELLRVEPDNELANGMLAGIYAELKMPERATACYERVLGINPANVLARFQLGLLQLTHGKPREAAATLQPNLSDKSEFLSHFYSGVALLELQQTDAARALLEHVEHRMPKTHDLWPQLQTMLHALRS